MNNGSVEWQIKGQQTSSDLPSIEEKEGTLGGVREQRGAN